MSWLAACVDADTHAAPQAELAPIDPIEPSDRTVPPAPAVSCGAAIGARWNDPSVWTGNPTRSPVWYPTGGGLPQAGLPPTGAVVSIGPGVQLRLDGTPRDLMGTPVELAGLEIAGGLYVDCDDLELRVDWIDVLDHATLQIGTETYPYTGRANITMTDSFPNHACSRNLAACRNGNGDADAKGTGLPMMIRAWGATVDLHGRSFGRAWSTLRAPVAAGATDLELAHAVTWGDGMEVAIASTDFEPEQGERCRIQNLGNGRLRCATPLRDGHWGGTVGAGATTVDASAEVMLLDRNIAVRIDRTIDDPAGQVLIQHGHTPGRVRIDWVELAGLGHEGTLGVYSLHFHHAHSLAGSYVKHSSIRHSKHRAITLHSTQDLELVDNVAYDIRGHAIYLEDGSERGHLIEGNVVAGTRAIEGDPNRVGDDKPASFYLSNLDNRIRNNRAAGSAAYGFYIVCLTAHAPVDGDNGCVWAPPTEFSGNVAHSNRYNGVHLDTMFYVDPSTPGADSVHLHWQCLDDGAGGCRPAEFSRFTAFKNGYYGAWIRTHGASQQQRVETRLAGWRVADNRTGFYLASGGWQNPDDSRSVITDAVVIGESENVGNPDTPFEANTAGRSLPNVHPDCAGAVCEHGGPLASSEPYRPSAWSDPYQPIVGVDVYDGHLRVEASTFSDFTTRTWLNTVRPAAAFSQTSPLQFHLNTDDNPWAVDPRNEAESITLVRANPVYMRAPLYWGESGAATPVFRILDGSGSNTLWKWIVPQTPLLDPGAGRTILAGANAWLVDRAHAYAQLQVQNNSFGADTMRYLDVTRQDGVEQLIRSPELDPDRFGFQALVGAGYGYDLDFVGGGQCPFTTPRANCLMAAVPPAALTHLVVTLRFGKPGDRLTVTLPYTGAAQRVTFASPLHGDCRYDALTGRLRVTLILGPGDMFRPLEAKATITPGSQLDPGYCGPP